MARNTDLTQEKINEVADGLHGKGIKPSPNNVREILGTGSFSTIKQLLDVWKEKQKEDDSVFVPDTPEFAYRLVDKLHKELYLQNRQSLDSERQQLQLSKQEIEAEKSEMMVEISHLEDSITELKGEVAKKDNKLNQAKADLEKNQEKLDNLDSELTAKKIEIATLTEREKQQALQLKEKDVVLKRAEKLEQTLNKQIEELMKKLPK
ncbi:MAG: DNA-binding protein [Methylococcaceae bacterium]